MLSSVFVVFNISRNLSFANSYKGITVNCQNCFEITNNISNTQSRVLILHENKHLGVYMEIQKPPYLAESGRKILKSLLSIKEIYNADNTRKYIRI